MPLKYSHSSHRDVPSLPAAPTPVNLQNAVSISTYIISSLTREHILAKEVWSWTHACGIHWSNHGLCIRLLFKIFTHAPLSYMGEIYFPASFMYGLDMWISFGQRTCDAIKGFNCACTAEPIFLLLPSSWEEHTPVDPLVQGRWESGAWSQTQLKSTQINWPLDAWVRINAVLPLSFAAFCYTALLWQ